MAGFSSLVLLAHASTCWADVAPPPIVRLDPQTRGQVILALAGLLLLGGLMMGLTWLAFRTLRRQFRQTDEIIQRQQNRSNDDDWTKQPLADESAE